MRLQTQGNTGIRRVRACLDQYARRQSRAHGRREPRIADQTIHGLHRLHRLNTGGPCTMLSSTRSLFVSPWFLVNLTIALPHGRATAPLTRPLPQAVLTRFDHGPNLRRDSVETRKPFTTSA